MSEAGPSLALELATAPDAPVIAALHGESFVHEPWSARAVGEILAMPGAFGYLAGDGRRPVGFVLARAAADQCEILSMAVAPPARRRGIGRALLVQALERAVRLGCRAAYLEVAEDDSGAGAFYRATGFRPCGRRPDYYARHGAPAAAAVVMCRALG